MKQSKGEAENALLCQLWGGRGDINLSANGIHGFDRTSMSTCVVIQPACFLKEIDNLRGNDALLKRYLVLSAKAVFFYKSAAMPENNTILQGSPKQNFVNVMDCIYSENKHDVNYVLSPDALDAYDSP